MNLSVLAHFLTRRIDSIAFESPIVLYFESTHSLETLSSFLDFIFQTAICGPPWRTGYLTADLNMSGQPFGKRYLTWQTTRFPAISMFYQTERASVSGANSQRTQAIHGVTTLHQTDARRISCGRLGKGSELGKTTSGGAV